MEYFMQLDISGHRLPITAPIKEYITNKIGKLGRHHDHITSIHVIVSVEKLIQKAEAAIHVSGGEIFAATEHKDLYAAIDILEGKLDRQFIKHKEKTRGR